MASTFASTKPDSNSSRQYVKRSIVRTDPYRLPAPRGDKIYTKQLSEPLKKASPFECTFYPKGDDKPMSRSNLRSVSSLQSEAEYLAMPNYFLKQDTPTSMRMATIEY